MASNLSELFGSIEQISPIFLHTKCVRVETKNVSALVLGCDPCYAVLSNLPIQEGRFFTPRDAVSMHNVCVIGIRIKEQLFGKASAIGQYIFVRGIGLQVVGVLDSLEFGLYDEAYGVFLTRSLFKKIFPQHSHYVSAIRLTLMPTARAAVMEEKFRSYFARHLNFSVTDTKALRLFSMVKHAHRFHEFFKNISVFNVVIGICLLITGMVSMSNMMLVAIQERRQEMAIRRVLGGRVIEIVAMVVSEVVMVTLVAGMFGFAAGFALLQLLNTWVVPLGKAYYLSTLTCPSELIFGGLGVIALTGGLAGMLPAMCALRIKPVVVLGSQ